MRVSANSSPSRGDDTMLLSAFAGGSGEFTTQYNAAMAASGK